VKAAETLAAWAADVSLDDIPEDVATHAKLHLLDALGCGLAASALGIAVEGRLTMAELGGSAEATVIGFSEGMPAANAAFANAMSCHGLDFDDTHADSVSHVSTVTCPTALAVSEARGLSGAEALTAIVAGNETTIRIGMAAAGLFHRRGFHPTAICGVFGAAVTASWLGQLDAATTASALGIAGSFAGGLFAYLADGTATKPMHPAWAAHGGVLAARLAAHGAAGPPSILEGKFGLYHAFLGASDGEIDIDAQLADLGSRWETPRIAYKPYPACHFIHGALGATSDAAAGLDPADVEEIVVTVPEAGVSLVLEPIESKRAPRSEYEAKFSLPYSAASMIVRGTAGVADYTAEAIADPHVLDVARRVRYEVKDYPTYPRAFPGGVRIHTRSGAVLEAELAYQRGGPEAPWSEADVRSKFRENAALALSADESGALEDAVLALEDQADLRAALAPLRVMTKVAA
jgi:2-methylcitrate dehydratase PrpD